MRISGRGKSEEIQEEDDAVSLCSLYAGSETFGIDTRKIREVLGQREPQRVPMSPPFVAGVVPYRGEVLTTVNLRALLEMEEQSGGGYVLVMEDEVAAERFGLVVDAVGGVVTVSARSLEANPCTLEARGRWLFDGAYKMEAGLMVRLDPQRLCPSRLSETGLFRKSTNGDADASLDRR
ncbi:MAG: chemotaxis protein CheW [Edaphobacter sp.]